MTIYSIQRTHKQLDKFLLDTQELQQVSRNSASPSHTSTALRHVGLVIAFVGSLLGEAWAGHDADLNDDGVVNSLDVSLISSCVGQDPQKKHGCQTADLNHDQRINTLDASIVSSQFGKTGFPTLELGQPVSSPSAIHVKLDKPPDERNPSPQVVFAVKAFGVKTLPTSLTLHEVSKAGKVVNTLGSLTDEGTNGDVHHNDGLYGGTFRIDVTHNDERQRLFQATVTHQGRTLTSPLYALLQTRFPVGPAPSEPEQVLPQAPTTPQRALGNEVIIGVLPTLTPADIQAIVEKTVPGAQVIGSIPRLAIYQVRLPTAGVKAVNETIAAFQAQKPKVRYAEPALIPQLFAYPNDPEYVNRAGIVTQTNLLKIRADKAWLGARGAANVKIAIIDTGINGSHEDFMTSGISKVLAGHDEITNAPLSHGSNSDGMGASDCHANGHGTRVAGVAAAIGDNSQGVAGVAWDTQLVPVRAVDNCLPSNHLFLISGIDWAASMTTAQIINVSAGLTANVPGTPEFDNNLPEFNPTATGGVGSLLEAILTIRDRAGGAALLVAAAGNNNTDVKHFPCAYTDSAEFQNANAIILCVGANTNNDLRLQGAEPSNFGPWVNIWAPADGVNTTTVSGGYDVAFQSQGTSMAAPLVAGAAAVLWSQHPTWSVQQIHERLLTTAASIELGGAAGTGHRLNLYQAVTSPPTRAYFSDFNTPDIHRVNLDGGGLLPILSGLTLPGSSLALDKRNGKLFWTNERVSGTIRRANIDGTGTEGLLPSGIRAQGIALDLPHGKVYWTDFGSSPAIIGPDTIHRANIDGTAHEELLSGLFNPRGIALDIIRGKMYWGETGAPSDPSSHRIRRANVDGSEVENLLTQRSATDIALDLDQDKIYWIDQDRDNIGRANLNGTAVEILVDVQNPGGIALDLHAEKIYWTAQLVGIQRSNLDGTNVETVLDMGLNTLRDIILE
ncbi:MAG: hypothetical protein NPIRA04_10790 [Nitrospirales bacterium]|nr:MAG: hypothetical protein NPIRA04_10790 [Nitrospirales bacterium]